MFLTLEDTVLGMALNDPEDLARAVALGVDDDCFEEVTNLAIWQALRGWGIQTLDGYYPLRIEELKGSVPLTQNIEFYAAELVIDRRRRLLVWGHKDLANRLLNHKPFAPLEPLLGAVTALQRQTSKLIKQLNRPRAIDGEGQGRKGASLSGASAHDRGKAQDAGPLW